MIKCNWSSIASDKFFAKVRGRLYIMQIKYVLNIIFLPPLIPFPPHFHENMHDFRSPSFLPGCRLLPCFNGVDARGFSRGTPWQAREPDCVRLQQGTGSRRRVQGQNPWLGAPETFICLWSENSLSLCVCVCAIYNRERSQRKIVFPIDFSRFLCHLRGVP